jgi:hypothetical protein
MCICGTGTHNEADCYHLHQEKLLESVKAMQKKLATEKNAKKVIMYSQSPRETAYVTIHRAFGAKKLQGLPKDTWAFDSGASKHMCHEFNAFITYTAFNEKHIVELGDAHCIPAHGVGSVNLICEVDGQLSLQLTEVLYVPDLQMSLLSQQCLDRKGCRTVIDGGLYSVFYKDSEILRSTSQTDLYLGDVAVSYTETKNSKSDNDVVMTAAKVPTKAKSLYEWHCALGHTNIKNVKLLGNTSDSGIKVNGGGEMALCETCILGKQHTRISKGPTKPTTQPLELIHIDTDGPWQVGSLHSPGKFSPIPSGSVHYLALTDDFTGYVWTYF